MAYTLQAFIGDEEVLKRAVVPGAKVVSLVQGKAMIPLPPGFLKELGIPVLPLIDKTRKTLPDELLTLAQKLVGDGKLVYVEADFFGGDGTQACVTWNGISGPSEALIDQWAINVALRFLGVEKGNHFDEFAALGLGRNRATEDW
jgi:hypothetical protein